ncbi:neuronal acetylcholine receptor subunit alpha-5-like [Ylistrum balloti]|uniref:neuronal acetylcholine receptor subunit alpha-5-like n=1 Tax=Ylistrum balloti TaxID=509963 RepID=UPI002905894F|nr:neuronal acetylcholine receptor subunit alpha-5-like [Ylistrum balloti]
MLSSCLTIFLIVTIRCDASNSTHRSILHDSLLHGYNDRVRPDGPGDGQILVSVYFTLMSLKEFDVQMSRFSVSGFLTSSWSDERLRWFPPDHGEILSLQLPQDEVWTPGFVLWNSYSSLTKIGFRDAPVRVYSDGLAIWNPGQVFETSCNADVTYFPFDIQRCTLDFNPYGYNTDELNIIINDTHSSMGESTLNTMWEVLSTSMYVTSVQNELMVHVSVTFRRRGFIFVLLIILPVVLMSLVNLAVFFIPVEEGNRIDFATTMLLTISVAMTVVGSYLPQSSLPQISIMCYMVSIHVFISMLVMVFTVKSVQIYHKSDADEISTLAKFWTKMMLSKRREKVGFIPSNTTDITKVQELEKPNWITTSSDGDREREVKYNHQDENEDSSKKEDEPKITWKEVGSTFDTFSFIVFILMIGVLDFVTISMVILKGETAYS